MKIPFTLEAWLQDKSQKVIDNKGNELVICSFEFTSDEPYIHAYEKKNGCGRKGYKLDEVFFCPKPELTEFEQEVRVCVTKNLTTHIKDGNGGEMSSTVFIDDDTAKKMAAELLDLAREEIEEELEEKVIQDYWKQAHDRCVQAREVGKAEALKEIEQDPESSYAFKRGVEYGKEEALKDLPRWKKATNSMTFVNSSNILFHNGYYLGIKDLEKLPKED